MYVINIIYKLCINLICLVLNLLQIFCVKILKEMKRTKRKKTLLSAFLHSGPSVVHCCGPGPSNRKQILKGWYWEIQSHGLLHPGSYGSRDGWEVLGSNPDTSRLVIYFTVGPMSGLAVGPGYQPRGTCPSTSGAHLSGP
jgi:hypothetical protein